MNPENQKDEQLWQIAKRRANFRTSLYTYMVVNLFLVAIWYFTNGPHSYFWPIWGMLGWGLGIAMQYYKAYHSDSNNSVEEEYEKLKRQKQSQL
jgi:hypothetical protein